MGFEDRDYYRSESGGGFFSGGGSAVKGLIAVNLVVFLLQVLTTKGAYSTVSDWLQFLPSDVLRGQIWRLFTYGVGYEGTAVLLTFLMNVYFMWIFGKTIEEMYGARELVLFYVASTFTGAVVCLVAALISRIDLGMMGCAVPATAIFVLYAWHHPRAQILLFFLIPVEIWIVVVFGVIVNFFSAAMGGFSGGLAIGLLTSVGFALLYGWGGRRIEEFVPTGRPQFRMPRRKPKLRVYEPEQRVSLDREVDEILAKIHEQGEASLTDRERKTLQEASRRYKKT